MIVGRRFAKRWSAAAGRPPTPSRRRAWLPFPDSRGDENHRALRSISLSVAPSVRVKNAVMASPWNSMSSVTEGARVPADVERGRAREAQRSVAKEQFRRGFHEIGDRGPSIAAKCRRSDRRPRSAEAPRPRRRRASARSRARNAVVSVEASCMSDSLDDARGRSLARLEEMNDFCNGLVEFRGNQLRYFDMIVHGPLRGPCLR